jgi:hypothetical protein
LGPEADRQAVLDDLRGRGITLTQEEVDLHWPPVP